jgi:hypothetical protein
MQYLKLQGKMQNKKRQHALVSSVMQKNDDSFKNIISNLK